MKIVTLASVSLLAMGLAAPAFADNHMKGKLDTDGNGVISKSEFLAAQEARFAEIDSNNNGEITQEEMKEHRSEKREKMKEKREKMKEYMSE